MNNYTSGYIYANAVEREQRESKTILRQHFAIMRSRKDLSGTAWEVSQTPLKNYGGRLGDFDKYLAKKAVQARKTKTKLKVLDIGIASGKQWKEFMQKYSDCVELHGTNIETTPDPLIPITHKRTTAALLHKKYPAEHFDLIISHLGVHTQHYSALENIIYLLKPGGEAIVSGQKEPPLLNERFHLYARPIRRLPKVGSGVAHWTIHFKKHKNIMDKILAKLRP